MAKTKKPSVRFFSAEEKEFLKQFLNTPKGGVHPPELVSEFCTKFDRDIRGIYQYVSRYRNNKIANLDSAPVEKQKAVPVKSTPVVTDFTAIKRNEFIIPVTNWELRTENGQTNLILKFK